MTTEHPIHRETAHKLARYALFSFIVTFIFEQKHLWSFLILLVLVTGFGVIIFVAGNDLGNVMGPRLEKLESDSSP